MQVIARYWRYSDGQRPIPEICRHLYNGKETEYDEDLVGWHCSVWATDWNAFDDWMKKNIKGKYESDHRFNSGDPFVSVHLKDKDDALLFKLVWNPTPDRFQSYGL